MWLWRQNVQYNKGSFFKDILLTVLFFHGLLLCLLFLGDNRMYHHERFVLSSTNMQSTVVFMPLHKKVLQEQVVNKATLDQVRKVIHHQAYEQQKKSVDRSKKVEKQNIKHLEKIVARVENKEKVIEIPASLPIKKAATTIQSVSKEIVNNIEKNSKIEKKIETKSVIKPPLNMPKKQVEKVVPKKTIVAKEIVTREKIEPKKESVPPAAKKNDQIAPQVQALPVAKNIEDVIENKFLLPDEQSVVDKDDPINNMIDLDTPISFVGSYDLEMMLMKESIMREVSLYYTPPIGTKKDAVCQLTVFVGSLGKAEKVTVSKSSGSIANDMCARAALLKIKFPHKIIGKEIIVELGQS